LIAALGGEGGGVLAGWIANAAVASGHVDQPTSIPGVAQRTGATTYYIEILPHAGNGAARPVLALSPSPGEVDRIASELRRRAPGRSSRRRTP
jgi:indolepyruvate ferredoxin oxidoreductase beta subunit